MKKIILMLSLLLLPLVFAQQPNVIDPLSIGALSISSPTAPSTTENGECVPWEVKDEYCAGDIRHYTMCQKTTTGGIWQLHSEDCKNYGENVKCMLGECQKTSTIFLTIILTLAGLIIGLGLGLFIPLPLPAHIKSLIAGVLLAIVGYLIGGAL